MIDTKARQRLQIIQTARATTWGLIAFSLSLLLAACDQSQPGSQFPAGGFGHDHYVYIGHEQQVQVYDVARPDNPQLIATWQTPGDVRRLVTDGSTAYIVHQPSVESWLNQTGAPDGGIQRVDISRPRQPQIKGHYRAHDTAQDIIIHGHLLYLADWEGLTIVEWRPPGRPWQRGYLPLGLVRMAIDDDLLLGVWGGCSFRSGFCQGGLRLIDISRPETLLLWGEITAEQRPAYDVALLKTPTHRYALVAGKGLWVVDITDPASPQTVALQEFTDGFYHARIVTKEQYAILATDAHIRIYDLGRPENPELVGQIAWQIDWQSPPLDMMLAGNGEYLYVTTWDGLTIVDIRDPQRPFLASITYYDKPISPPSPTKTPYTGHPHEPMATPTPP